MKSAASTTKHTRNGKFIAVANMKGGVGKTTTVVSLAESLAAMDSSSKVLVIDLDPQASASVAIAGDDALTTMIENERTFERFLEDRLIHKKKSDLHNIIHPTICGTYHGNKQLDVALLPCGPQLRSLERQLIYELARANFSLTSSDGKITKLFKEEIGSLRDDFDFIIFDCAPGISPVTEIAIRLADLAIVPTIPDRLSVYGLNAFYEGIWVGGGKGLPKPKSPPCIIVVRMDKRIKQHNEVLQSLCEAAAEPDAGFKMMRSQIPTSAALVEALMKPEGQTFTQKYTSDVIGNILKPLAIEVRSQLHAA